MSEAKRTTSQRTAIESVLQRQNQPLTLAEILDYGKAIVPSLNQATVYRNLKWMIRTGVVQKIEHPRLGSVYEVSVSEHHHIFHCRICDRSFRIAGCGLNQAGTLPAGFTVENHEVYLFGVCRSCKS